MIDKKAQEYLCFLMLDETALIHYTFDIIT